MGFADMTAGMGVKMLYDGQRRTKPILTCELIPQSTWAKNLRTAMDRNMWDIARKIAYKKARYKCEVCSGKGPKWPVECHEHWEWNQVLGVQKLSKLIALCPSCHAVKHWGFSRVNGMEAECRDHIAFVNGWTVKEIDDHVDAVFKEWKRRSRLQWEVDLGNLAQFGLTRRDINGMHGGYVITPDTDPEAYAGPEEVPWNSIPEDCL